MSVQLHFNGSVFDLDTDKPDLFWVQYIRDMTGAIDDEGDGDGGFYVELDGDLETFIPYRTGDRVVVVAPRGTSERSLELHKLREARNS